MRGFVYLGLLGAVACAGDDTERWVEARAEWQESAPQQYVARACNTGFSGRRCTVSSVSAGEPLETLVQDGDGSWDAREPAVDVVAGMFDAATQEVDGDCERRVEQYAGYAFPGDVYEDCGEEGSGIEITCFVPDTIDVAQCQ